MVLEGHITEFKSNQKWKRLFFQGEKKVLTVKATLRDIEHDQVVASILETETSTKKDVDFNSLARDLGESIGHFILRAR